MKRIPALATILICFLILTACGSKGNDLMENASPGTSALALYVYDGQATTRGFLFQSDVEQDILDDFASVSVTEAPDWSPEQITFPIYGLEITDTEGRIINAAWSNGYWITQDGTAYHFDYDFAALEAGYDWTNKDSWSTITIMPCAYYLTKDADGWISDLLTPAEELSPPEKITARLISINDGKVTIALTHTGDTEWCYGTYFNLNVLLDGVWYSIPTTPGNWAFNDIGIILPAGGTQEETYSLTMYGDLPAGQYRLLVNQTIPVEFTVE